MIGKLLPPSVGGTVNANDNGDDAPAPELEDAAEVPALDAGDAEEEEEGPATVRDPAPYGAADAGAEGSSMQWATLKVEPDRVG